jgi:hypothetical protein
MAIRKVKRFIKKNPASALSVPAVLCFIQFITYAVEIYRSGVFDKAAMNQLLSSVDGFEAVCLAIIMLVLQDKKK